MFIVFYELYGAVAVFIVSTLGAEPLEISCCLGDPTLRYASFIH